MCGIWASAGKFSNDARKVASDALDLVRHRGPDGVSVWGSEDESSVVIGHRRLAIIDLDGRACQPMTSNDGRYVLTFNGEIFNYHEIRCALLSENISLRTTSDTEVLLEAIARWGLEVLSKLRGFFAFVLFDRRERCLLAVRDRYGIKPLYYLAAPEYLAFASEIKQFRALPDFKRQLNDHALVDYLAFGLFDHSESTFFKGVSQVEPGQALIAPLDRLGLNPGWIERRMWAIDSEYASEGDLAHVISLRASLTAAVGLGLNSDVPMGVALSGGLDSSIVATIAACHGVFGSRRLRAVGVFFDQADIDESRYARAVAEKMKIDLVSATVTYDELEDLFRATVWSFDEPVVRASMLAQMKLYQVFKASGIKVVLNGQGGDEMFCGYRLAWPSLVLDMLLEKGLLRCINAARASSFSVQEIWTEIAPRGLVKHVLLRAMRKPSVMEEFLGRLFDPDVARGRVHRGRSKESSPKGENRSTRLSRRLIEAGNLPMLLHYDDRSAMASGVESRPVLLDPELVAVALSLPASLKIKDGRLKGALRAAMHNELPAVVRDRPDKLGFPTPEKAWAAGIFGDFLIERAQAGLETFSASLTQVIDVDEIRSRLCARRFEGTPVWALASLGEWATQF